MNRHTTNEQIAFRYRTVDSSIGMTRETAKRMGVDETQAIHIALCTMAVKLLPQYDADDGPPTVSQIRQIKKLVPQDKKRSAHCSLFEVKTA